MKLPLLILASFLTLLPCLAWADSSFHVTLSIPAQHTSTINLLVPKGEATITVEPDSNSRVSCEFFDPKSHFTGLVQKNMAACTGFVSINSPLEMELKITNEDHNDHHYDVSLQWKK